MLVADYSKTSRLERQGRRSRKQCWWGDISPEPLRKEVRACFKIPSKILHIIEMILTETSPRPPFYVLAGWGPGVSRYVPPPSLWNWWIILPRVQPKQSASQQIICGWMAPLSIHFGELRLGNSLYTPCREWTRVRFVNTTIPACMLSSVEFMECHLCCSGNQ